MAAAQLPMSEVVSTSEHTTVGRRAATAAANAEGGLAVLIATNRALVDGAHAMASEALAFWHRRVKEVLATAGRLAECRTPQDSSEVLQDHAKAMWHAYLDHGRRVSEMVAKTMVDAPSPGRPTST